MATDTLEIFGTEYSGVTGVKATDDQSGTKVYIRPQGTKSISANGTNIDVAEYASVDVNVSSGAPTIQSLTVTPTTSQQTFNASGVDGYKPVTVSAVPTMTLPWQASSTRTGDQITSFWPEESVRYINIPTGYNDTAQYYELREMSLDSLTVTQDGTYNVADDQRGLDGYKTVVVSVSGGGTSKNTQVVQGTTRTNASALTAIGAELTVSTTGTYDIYYSCFRTNTSSSYTWATRLYINGTAYGNADNTTWTNNQQNTHLSNISLTAGDKLRVYGRNTRGTSYYVCAPMLVIIEV